MAFLLGWSLLLPVHTVNCVQTLKALDALEVAEQKRREKFDRQFDHEVRKVDQQNPIVGQTQRAKLQTLKDAEMTRRMKWESKWMAREHQLLYGRADVSTNFNEYMAEQAAREEEMYAVGENRYRRASEVIGMGKVANMTMGLLGEGVPSPRAKASAGYTMTWKRQKEDAAGQGSRPGLSSLMMRDEDDTTYGFPDGN
jgi:hypothetical protein